MPDRRMTLFDRLIGGVVDGLMITIDTITSFWQTPREVEWAKAAADGLAEREAEVEVAEPRECRLCGFCAADFDFCQYMRCPAKKTPAPGAGAGPDPGEGSPPTPSPGVSPDAPTFAVLQDICRSYLKGHGFNGLKYSGNVLCGCGLELGSIDQHDDHQSELMASAISFAISTSRHAHDAQK